ncbi:hypothetical protein [Mycoplasma sp. E35C]|uniref:hypothetical protein n=1 Tax=Mycoplasma sp. E35C TaxID=2801918 RepID=UPI002105D816|nr:hypothetical protein [Mycoplasma sp. E35C]
MTGIMAAQMIIGPLIRGAVTVSNIVNDVKSQPDPEGYMVGISDNGPAPVRSSFSSAKARHSFLSPYASSLYSGF